MLTRESSDLCLSLAGRRSDGGGEMVQTAGVCYSCELTPPSRQSRPTPRPTSPHVFHTRGSKPTSTARRVSPQLPPPRAPRVLPHPPSSSSKQPARRTTTCKPTRRRHGAQQQHRPGRQQPPLPAGAHAPRAGSAGRVRAAGQQHEGGKMPHPRLTSPHPPTDRSLLFCRSLPFSFPHSRQGSTIGGGIIRNGD